MHEGAEGLLRDKTRPSRIPALTLETVALVVARTHEAPPGETTRWTASLMARDAGISASSVHRIWRAHGLQPRRVHHNAVCCAQRARRECDRPQHAALPPSGIRPLSQPDRSTGAHRQGDPRHPRQLPRPNAPQGPRVAHPAPALHLPLTPTSCSWLNAVEGFFAWLTNRRLKRGVFHSLVDLQAAINRFLADHDESPEPFVWTADPDKIIAAVRRGHQALDSHH